MRILFVITRAERGGAQVHVLDLISNMPRRYESSVVTGEDGFLIEECKKCGVAVHIIPDLVQPIHPLNDLKALIALVKHINTEKPDVVHAHTSKAGLLARIAAWFTGTPVIFTVHTWSFADGLPLLQRWIAIPLEWIAAARKGKIITVSEANQKVAEQMRIGRKDDLHTIWNGIPDVPLRANPGSHQVKQLIMVARFVPQKDHRLLLLALKGIEANWNLMFVGDGPYLKEIQNMAAELGLDRRIQFLGNRSDIPELLAESDIFLLPSNWEGLPISILEAMRAGLPVIATNVGGVAEAVTDGVTGFLVAAQDVDQLRTRLRELMESPDLMFRMGQNGRDRYEADFQIESMVKRTVSIYEEVAGSALRVSPDESFSNTR
jgi:glycosyltransferase involved in cell wall biosynthesis